MRDTPEPVEALYSRMLLQKSGEERLRMGCAMFDAARALIRSSLIASGITEPAALRIELLYRTYGGDLDSALLTKIAARLAR